MMMMMMMIMIILNLLNTFVCSEQTRFTSFSLYTLKFLAKLIRLRSFVLNTDAIMPLSASRNHSIDSSQFPHVPKFHTVTSNTNPSDDHAKSAKVSTAEHCVSYTQVWLNVHCTTTITTSHCHLFCCL